MRALAHARIGACDVIFHVSDPLCLVAPSLSQYDPSQLQPMRRRPDGTFPNHFVSEEDLARASENLMWEKAFLSGPRMFHFTFFLDQVRHATLFNQLLALAPAPVNSPGEVEKFEAMVAVRRREDSLKDRFGRMPWEVVEGEEEKSAPATGGTAAATTTAIAAAAAGPSLGPTAAAAGPGAGAPIAATPAAAAAQKGVAPKAVPKQPVSHRSKK